MAEWIENKLYVSGSRSSLKQFEHDIQQQIKQMFLKRKNTSNTSWGHCKFFDKDRGFGFIKCEHNASPNHKDYFDDSDEDDQSDDIFVHCSELQCGINGVRHLDEGEFVMFEIVTGARGMKAVNVTGPKGRYISGHHNFMPYQREQANTSINSIFMPYQREHIGLNIESMDNNTSISIKFSTKSDSPLSWLQHMASNYSQLSFKLRFESDMDKIFGCVMYEKGKRIHTRNISLSHIWKKYKSELKTFLLKEWQNVYFIPIRTALSRCQIGDDIQTIVFNFMPIQRIDELHSVQQKQFIANWKYYKEHKIEHKNKDSNTNQKKIEMLTAKKEKISLEVQNIGKTLRTLNLSAMRITQCQAPLMEEIQIMEQQIIKLGNIKSTENKPNSKLWNYHIAPFSDVSDFSDFFNKIHNKIESIFCAEDIEIFDYSKSVQSHFWSGFFQRLLDECDIYIQYKVEPFIVRSAKNGDVESVRQHILNGYDLDRRQCWTETDMKYGGYSKSWDWFGDSALMIAAKNGNHEMVKELLLAGADPMLVSMGGNDEPYDAMKAAKSASKRNGSTKFGYIVSIIGAVNTLWKKLNPSRSSNDGPGFSMKRERKYIPKLNDIKNVIDSFK